MFTKLKINNFLFSKLFILFFLVASGFAFMPRQKEADVLGVWETQKAFVLIYKQGDKFFGKIEKLKNPLDENNKPKVDKNNPDEAKRKNPLVGMNVLSDLKWDASEKYWDGGNIYNPEDGKTYSCRMKLKDAKTLEVRGYLGFSLLGKTQTWKR